MNLNRRAALALALALLPAGCNDGARLSVQLRTDFLPGLEFTVARTRVESASGATRTWNSPAFTMDDPIDGVRLVDFADLEPGAHTVRVGLLGRDSALVAERRLDVVIDDAFTVTAVLPRDCVTRTCADGSSACESACDDPRCAPESPEFCAAPDCTTAAECDAPAASCAMAECVLGSCFAAPVDGACGAGAVCVPEAGCAEVVGLTPDAGSPDGGPADAGPDAGLPPPPPGTLRFPAQGAIVGAPSPTTTVKLIVEPVGGFELDYVFELFACAFDDLRANTCDTTGAPLLTRRSQPGESFVSVPIAAAPEPYILWRVRACRVGETPCSGAPSATRWFRASEPSDLDGDGAAEVMVSARLAPAPGTDERGQVYVFEYGGSWSLRGVAETSVTSLDSLGHSLAAGQLTNAAGAEMVAGAVFHSDTIQHGGRVYVFEEAAGPTFTSNVIEPPTPRMLGQFGHAVAVIGDLDDVGAGPDLYGTPELLIGEPSETDYDTAGVAGRAHVYAYSPSSRLFTLRATIMDPDADAGSFGAAVLGCDLNGDGVDEIVVGAPHRGGSCGAVYVFGASGGTLATPVGLDGMLAGPCATQPRFGFSLACGDLNRDGYRDLVVGAPGVDAAVLVRGDPALTLNGTTRITSAVSGRFGYALAVTDADGDGGPELQVISPQTGQLHTYRDPVTTPGLAWMAPPIPTLRPATPTMGGDEGCVARLGNAGSGVSGGVLFSRVPTSGAETFWTDGLGAASSAADLTPSTLPSGAVAYGWACR